MARGPHLTKRERAFILLVCRTPEPTHAEIASRWGVTEKTVETHRANVYRKLAVHSR
ncbi:MAG: helix-turn-helix transcriptional regulator, partial [Flavobacteriales bacterium]|nr:helix-turn-helix transcriptional regulator [Flavobacteriales bacterium]